MTHTLPPPQQQQQKLIIEKGKWVQKKLRFQRMLANIYFRGRRSILYLHRCFLSESGTTLMIYQESRCMCFLRDDQLDNNFSGIAYAFTRVASLIRKCNIHGRCKDNLWVNISPTNALFRVNEIKTVSTLAQMFSFDWRTTITRTTMEWQIISAVHSSKSIQCSNRSINCGMAIWWKIISNEPSQNCDYNARKNAIFDVARYD